MSRPQRAKARVNASGRNSDRVGSSDRVLILRRSLFQSPRFSAASPTARALALELLSMHNGRNNGGIFLSVRDATDRLGFADYRPALTAFEELQMLKLIQLTIEGNFNITVGGVSKAHAWRLNFVDENGQPASEEALSHVDLNALPEKMRKRMGRRQKVLKRYLKDLQQGKFSVGDFTTLDARRVGDSTTPATPTVVESTSAETGNRANPSLATVEDSTTHILHHIPSDGCRAWWLADSNLVAQARLAIAIAAASSSLPFSEAA